MFTPRLMAVCAVLLLAGTLSAQQPAPQLLSVFPMGAKAGETVEVTVAGHGLDGSEKLLFSAKGFTAEVAGVVPAPKQPPQGQPSTSVKFKVTAPANANGTFDVRVVGKNGLSNPRAFVVGKLKDVNETEPNNDIGPAQKIELETTVNGVISAPTDVDFVTFSAKTGQKITVYCLTSGIDSKLQADLLVTTPEGKQLASNRGYRNGDAVLEFQAPADGDYLVRVSQFAYTTGGFDHFYRLTVTTTPWVPAVFPPVAAPKLQAITNTVIPPTSAMIDATESPTILGGNPVLVASNPVIVENDKNNTAETAQAVQVPCDVAGKIAKKGERDWYSFTAKKGDVWTLEVFADRIGSPVDAYFILSDEKGKAITEQDDGADTLSLNQFYTKTDDPGRYRFAVPADGTYKVMVSTREAGVQFGPRDQYVLRIAKETPDFRVAVMPFSTHVPHGGTLHKGGATVFSVFVFRFDGFSDAIELGAENLPKGVACPKQVIGPGQTRANLVLTTESNAEEWDGFVTIVAKSGNLKHTARPFTITWPGVGVQQNQVPNVPMITRMDRGEGMALAIRGEAPFTLVPVEKELTAKAGGKVDVTLKITRKDTFKDPIAIVTATPNFGPKPQNNQPYPPVGTAPPASNEIKVSVDIPATLAPGTHTLVLRGVNGSPPPKGGNNAPLRVQPSYAAIPIPIVVEGAPKKK